MKSLRLTLSPSPEMMDAFAVLYPDIEPTPANVEMFCQVLFDDALEQAKLVAELRNKNTQHLN